MQPRETVRRQITSRDMFHTKVEQLGRDSVTRRKELTRTREAIARRTNHPDLLQLSETMKELGLDLGQKRADVLWLQAMTQKFPNDYETILEVWRTMQQLRQKIDVDPSDRQISTPPSEH